MANLAQLVNVLAPIVTSPEQMFLQSIYHPLRLFSDHLGDRAVDVHVHCATHELVEILDHPTAHRVADLGPFPLLDAVATRSGRKLMLSVVNRSPDSDITAEICFANDFPVTTARIEEVNATEWRTTNSFEAPDAVSVSERSIEKFANGVEPFSRPFPHGNHCRLGVNDVRQSRACAVRKGG